MRSIRQSDGAHGLPDFRNLGVMLRVLLAVNVGMLVVALARNVHAAALARETVELAGAVEPPLIGSLLVLYLLQPLARRLPAQLRVAAVLAVAVAAALAVMETMVALGTEPEVQEPWRAALWAGLAAGAVLAYLGLRARAFSPALVEARLMALTARIRPHFLFNSLNGVLGVMRSDPRRAEQALEELSDLFRVLMAENRELVPLGDELALCRQYLELERLRLGERLRVAWDIDACPRDALVPPLMLQPLLENAVYHGVEPAAEPAEVRIRIARRGQEVIFELTNPHHPGVAHSGGNRMALDNIRERLMLFFDLEARLDTGSHEGLYRVRIVLPYRRAARQP
ncbi:MAG: histidine kinase [Betaproteobacteria bacterium]|nr:histidine kinase [Betaproteobacteria bacterium]